MEEKFIKEFIQELEEVPNYEVNLYTIFRDLPDWDSMTSLMIVTMINENYNVIISPDEMRKAVTIGDLFKLI